MQMDRQKLIKISSLFFVGTFMFKVVGFGGGISQWNSFVVSYGVPPSLYIIFDSGFKLIKTVIRRVRNEST